MNSVNGHESMLIGGPERCQGPHLNSTSEKCRNIAVLEIEAPGIESRSVCGSCMILFRLNHLEHQLQGIIQLLQGGTHGQEEGPATNDTV